MTALDRSIELFARAHAAELDVAEQLLLHRAVGIIRRVHSSPAYLTGRRLDPADVDALLAEWRDQY